MYLVIIRPLWVVLCCLLPIAGVAQTAFYVSSSGNDANSGLSLSAAKLTVNSAIASANQGDYIFVQAGSFGGFTLDKRLTITGAGQSVTTITGQVTLSAAVSGTALMTVRHLTISNGAGPTGIDATQGFFLLEHIDCSGHSSNNLSIAPSIATDFQAVQLVSSSFNSAGSSNVYIDRLANINGLLIDNCSFDGAGSTGLGVGLYIDYGAETTPNHNAENVVIRNSTFSGNEGKGIYIERLSNALFENITIDGSGTDPSYAFNAGIDINLKWQAYSNILLRNVRVVASGAIGSNNIGSSPENRNPVAVVVKARTDAPSYNLDTASLTNLTIESCYFDGLVNDIRFGEAGKSDNNGIDMATVSVMRNTFTSNGSLLGAINESNSGVLDLASNYWGTSLAPVSGTNFEVFSSATVANTSLNLANQIVDNTNVSYASVANALASAPAGVTLYNLPVGNFAGPLTITNAVSLTASGVGTSTVINDVTFGSDVTLASGVTFAGPLDLGGQTLSGSQGNMVFTGPVTNGRIDPSSSSEIALTGTGVVSSVELLGPVYWLTINRAGDALTFVSNDVEVTSRLELGVGELSTTGGSVLLNDLAVTNQVNGFVNDQVVVTSSFSSGNVIQTHFPIGSQGVARPFSLHDVAVSGVGSYTARVIEAAPTGALGSGLDALTPNRYIQASATATPSAVGGVVFSYGGDDGVVDATNIRVAQLTAGVWENRGGAGASPLVANSGLDATLGDFALANATGGLNFNATAPIYVDLTASGANNGTSWSDAFIDLSSALAAASAGDTLWVAAGAYYPDSISPHNPSATFTLPAGVSLLGGFNATETNSVQADPLVNLTLLSGDNNRNGASDIGTDAYHVITLGGGSNRSLIRGVTFDRGTANVFPNTVDISGGGIFYGGSATIQLVVEQAVFENNSGFSGSAISVSSSGISSELSLSDVVVANNTGQADILAVSLTGEVRLTNVEFRTNATNPIFPGINTQESQLSVAGDAYLDRIISSGFVAGGASAFDAVINATNSLSDSLTITNSLFFEATLGAGAPVIRSQGFLTQLSNCTFADNSATVYGNLSGSNSMTAANCVIQGNTAPAFEDEATTTVSFTLTDETSLGTNVVSGGNNQLSATANFTDAPNDDYSLLSTSTALNVGNNAVVTTALDVAGAARIQTSQVDLGAFESSVSLLGTIYVNGATGNDINAGTTPLNPKATLTAGVETVTAGGTVEVASGTYAEDVILGKNLTLTGIGAPTLGALNRFELQNGASVTATGVQALTVNVNNDGGVTEDIREGYALTADNGILNVGAGTYSLGGTLQLARGVTFRGNGGAPNPQPILVDGSADTLISVIGENVTIENFQLTVNIDAFGPDNLVGIGANDRGAQSYNGLTVQDCRIESSGGTAFGIAPLLFNACGIQLQNGVHVVTIRRNYIGQANASQRTFGRGIRLGSNSDSGPGGVFGGTTAGEGNTFDGMLYGIQGVLNTTSFDINNNTFTNCQPIFVTTPQGGTTHFIRNNTITNPQSLVAQNIFNGLIELKALTDPSVRVEVTNNTISDVGVYGIMLMRAQNVLVDGNTLTPFASDTDYELIHINTKQQTNSNLGTHAPVDNITVTNNILNGSGTTGGVGIVIANHDNRSDPAFTNMTLGTDGNENDFGADLATFVELNDESGLSTSSATYTDLWSSFDVTTMAPVAEDFDFTENRFDVGGGLLEPSAMSFADLYLLEARVNHGMDDGTRGFVEVVTDNAYVLSSASVQNGNDALPRDGFTTNLEAASYADPVTFTRTQTLDATGVDALQLDTVALVGTGLVVSVADTLIIPSAGTLTLSDGVLDASSTEVRVLNASAGAVTSATNTAFVQGPLNRAVSLTGSYVYPVGRNGARSTTTLDFATSLGTMTALTVEFNALASTAIDANGGTNPLAFNGASFDKLLDGGFWSYTPTGTYSGGTYSLEQALRGFSNEAGSTTFGNIRRDDGTTPWEPAGTPNFDLNSGSVITVNSTGLTGFSDGAIAGSASPFPVELIAFTATVADARTAELYWATASELNSEGFVLYHAPGAPDDWQEVRRVASTGDVSSGATYTQQVAELAPGQHYFRLEQVDFDGTVTDLGVRSVTLTGSAVPLVERVVLFPNPVASHLTLRYSGASLLQASVRNLQGQLMHRQDMETGTSQLDFSGLSGGVYLLEVFDTQTGERFQERIIKR